MSLHREGIIIDEFEDDDESLDNRVLFGVYHALIENDLVLPSLPDMVIRIRQVANDENVAVEDIARIIQADANTAAYCINVANNAAFGGTVNVNNVLDAVVRMGITPTRDLVVAYTLRSLFAGTDVQSKKLMREAWKHSCRIAALSYVIARDVGRLNPERALLAGLLHDIGVTVLINKVQAYPSLLNDIVEFSRLCHELSTQIGAMVLRDWKSPDVFVNAALEAEHFTKPAGNRLDLADVVMLAHVHDRKAAPWSMQAANLAKLAIRKTPSLRHDHRLPTCGHLGRQPRTHRIDPAIDTLTCRRSHKTSLNPLFRVHQTGHWFRYPPVLLGCNFPRPLVGNRLRRNRTTGNNEAHRFLNRPIQ